MYLNAYLQCNDDFEPIPSFDPIKQFIAERYSSQNGYDPLILGLDKNGFRIVSMYNIPESFGFFAKFLSSFTVFIQFCFGKSISNTMKKNLKKVLSILDDLSTKGE